MARTKRVKDLTGIRPRGNRFQVRIFTGYDADTGKAIIVTRSAATEDEALRPSRVNFTHTADDAHDCLAQKCRAVIDVRTNIVNRDGALIEKDTKSHQMRRISIDSTTTDLLARHIARLEKRRRELGHPSDEDVYLFSYAPAHDRPCSSDGISHRYTKMTAALGIKTHLHALRHYSATELLTSGVDLRTVAGRLGHGGGGATTLRVTRRGWRGRMSRRPI